MKNLKLIAFLLVAVLFATALTGCVKVNETRIFTSPNPRISKSCRKPISCSTTVFSSKVR